MTNPLLQKIVTSLRRAEADYPVRYCMDHASAYITSDGDAEFARCRRGIGNDMSAIVDIRPDLYGRLLFVSAQDHLVRCPWLQAAFDEYSARMGVWQPVTNVGFLEPWAPRLPDGLYAWVTAQMLPGGLWYGWTLDTDSMRGRKYADYSVFVLSRQRDSQEGHNKIRLWEWGPQQYLHLCLDHEADFTDCEGNFWSIGPSSRMVVGNRESVREMIAEAVASFDLRFHV